MIPATRAAHQPLQIVRKDGFLAVPLPGPYPHESYGRWHIDCEINFEEQERAEETFRRLKYLILFVPDYTYKTQQHSIASCSERLWLPFDSASVSLGHELGSQPYGGCREVQWCSEHNAVKIGIYPPDQALWVVVEAGSSIMTRIKFLVSL